MDSGKNKEQIKITLAIGFIAAYLVIIFSFNGDLFIGRWQFITELIKSIFIIYGVIVSSCFFVYLSLLALELNSKEKKKINFGFCDIDLSLEGIKKVQDFFYNSGVSLIFLSFTMPFWLIVQILVKKYGILLGFIFSGLFGGFISGLILFIINKIKPRV